MRRIRAVSNVLCVCCVTVVHVICQLCIGWRWFSTVYPTSALCYSAVGELEPRSPVRSSANNGSFVRAVRGFHFNVVFSVDVIPSVCRYSSTTFNPVHVCVTVRRWRGEFNHVDRGLSVARRLASILGFCFFRLTPREV